MQILFNGQPMQCAAGQIAYGLLERLDRQQAGAVLAINQQIISHKQWTQHIMQGGDQTLSSQVIARG